jgi:LDH2 family malate/lactate/ureidoglycolate dehydrogenase
LLEQGPQQPRRFRQNAVLAAAFCDLAPYRRDADAFADAIRALPPAGAAPVMLPGDLEEQIATERRARGIPLPAGTLQRMGVTAARLGLAPIVP